MYLEFIFVILDYFKTINRAIIVYEWLIPFVASVAVFICLIYWDVFSKEIAGHLVTLLGVLIGFSITGLSVISIGSNKIIEQLKATLAKPKIKISHSYVNLYQLHIINFSYSVFIQVVALISCLSLLLLQDLFLKEVLLKLLLCFVLMLIFHVLLLTVRNISNTYFILIRG